MQSPPPSRDRWPAQLAAAVADARAARASQRQRTRATLWTLLHASLFASLRAQAGRVTAVSQEDLEDLASQKALELLLRAEEGAWDPEGRAEHEIAGYVARVARHALVDLARRRGRECPPPEDEERWAVAIAAHTGERAGPEDLLAAREFVRALRACLEALAPRARSAWFRRVWLERPSREIGVRLGVNAAHVDVIVQRARTTLRTCMGGKGQPEPELRPGAFVDVWAWLSAEPAATEGSDDAEQ
ncbi:MAG: sigma-70 family RNA polymerase sigma factor [Candidatus Eisenbacteria bacterium]